jgi:hypothetical protein
MADRDQFFARRFETLVKVRVNSLDVVVIAVRKFVIKNPKTMLQAFWKVRGLSQRYGFSSTACQFTPNPRQVDFCGG